jgi:hypothetical protein
LHDHECKCCTGVGELVAQTVDCESEGERQIYIKMFTECACHVCDDSSRGLYSVIIRQTNT